MNSLFHIASVRRHKNYSCRVVQSAMVLPQRSRSQHPHPLVCIIREKGYPCWHSSRNTKYTEYAVWGLTPHAPPAASLLTLVCWLLLEMMLKHCKTRKAAAKVAARAERSSKGFARRAVTVRAGTSCTAGPLSKTETLAALLAELAAAAATRPAKTIPESIDLAIFSW